MAFENESNISRSSGMRICQFFRNTETYRRLSRLFEPRNHRVQFDGVSGVDSKEARRRRVPLRNNAALRRTLNHRIQSVRATISEFAFLALASIWHATAFSESYPCHLWV